MVNYYSAVTPHLRNQPIYIQYSNHKELKTDNTLNQVSAWTCAGRGPQCNLRTVLTGNST